MLHKHEIPASKAVVYTNGQADSAKRQRRVVRRLLRDLVALAGPVVNDDLAGRSRKTSSRPQHQRLLYRRADSLSDADLDRLVREVGAARLMAALDRWTQPRFTIAAE